MKTKYYSEVLDKTFDTEEECLKAEEAFEEKHKAELVAKEERAKAAKEVEEAYRNADAAYKEANAKLSEFLKKYKYYHSTVTNLPSTKTLLDWFFEI